MLRDLVARFASAFRRSSHEPGTAQAILDVLPAQCQLIAEFHEDQIRFQAIDEHGFKSGWSGWFTWTGEPIMLNWDTFWVEDRWTS